MFKYFLVQVPQKLQIRLAGGKKTSSDVPILTEGKKNLQQKNPPNPKAAI